MADLLAASPRDRAALAELKRRGFAEPARALGNLHAMTPEPRAAELLAPLLPRLLDLVYEDLAVTDFVGARGMQNGLDRA